MITTQYNEFIRVNFNFQKKDYELTNLFFEKYDCEKIKLHYLIEFYEKNKKEIDNYIEKKYTLFDNQVIILIFYFLKFKKNLLVANWFLNENYLNSIINKC